MIDTDAYGHATPGGWWGHYQAAWKQAFPTKTRPGAFYGPLNRWITQTPAWDEWYFTSMGVLPPAHMGELVSS